MFVFIEKIMNDYHSIALNLVVFCNIHEVKTQKVCECQDANFNKNALVFLSSNYINWFFDYLFAKIVFFNIFLQHSLVSSAQYSNEFNLKFSCKLFQRWILKLFQRCDFFNDATFSTMRCLKLSNKLSRWRKFCKIKLYIDAKIAEMNESKFDDLLTSNMT